MRVMIGLVLFALSAGLSAEEENVELVRATLKLRLAEARLEHAEAEAAERNKLHEASALSAEELEEAKLARDEAAVERDQRALDVEEVTATKEEPRNGVAAPKIGQRDFAGERLALELKRNVMQEKHARDRLARIQLLHGAGTASAAELDEARAELAAAKAENEGLKRLVKIRQRFLAGELEEERAELLGDQIEAETELAGIRLELAVRKSALAAIQQAFESGRVTVRALRAARLEVLELETEGDVLKAELSHLKRLLAAK